MLFDHIRDQWNLLSAMFGVWSEDEFLITCKVTPVATLGVLVLETFLAYVQPLPGVTLCCSG